MYDFHSEDPTHLAFNKHELLDIVKQEETGWWAAMRRGGKTIGWIPQAFVRPLSHDMAERLRNVREELRVYEYDAEQLYKTAPISKIPFELEEPSPVVPEPMAPQMSPRRLLAEKSSQSRLRPHPPPSPITPVPQPPSYLSLHRSSSLKSPDPDEVLSRARADTIPLSPLRRKDVSSNTDLRGMREGDPPSTSDRRRLAKIRQLTGSDDAVGFISAVNSPWYLKSKYSDQLKYDNDGQVRSGTVVALVEKLTADTSKDAISESCCDRVLSTI